MATMKTLNLTISRDNFQVDLDNARTGASFGLFEATDDVTVSVSYSVNRDDTLTVEVLRVIAVGPIRLDADDLEITIKDGASLTTHLDSNDIDRLREQILASEATA